MVIERGMGTFWAQNQNEGLALATKFDRQAQLLTKICESGQNQMIPWPHLT